MLSVGYGCFSIRFFMWVGTLGMEDVFILVLGEMSLKVLEIGGGC